MKIYKKAEISVFTEKLITAIYSNPNTSKIAKTLTLLNCS